ncbi:MAG: hypothetical protein WC773_02955 [Patescibacteria group bacterium]|jgi:hypothetical protein
MSDLEKFVCGFARIAERYCELRHAGLLYGSAVSDYFKQADRALVVAHIDNKPMQGLLIITAADAAMSRAAGYYGEDCFA